MTRLFGLIGYPLSHSFSKKYFSEKFSKEGIEGCSYELFEIPEVGMFPELFQIHPNLKGINVTIPYKREVMPLLNRMDQSAMRVGAVNVVKKESDGSLTGFNSDYIGFLRSLENWAGTQLSGQKALVLGTGGAAAAVVVALEDLGVDFLVVSRQPGDKTITYDQLRTDESVLKERKLIINTTPVGTYPQANECPDIPYKNLTDSHFLYDLVYNPAETLFMKKGAQKGAKVKNGYNMLVLQAERAWEIWNQKS